MEFGGAQTPDEKGFLLKRNKCRYMQPSVDYLGYLVAAEGIHATTEKVNAI